MPRIMEAVILNFCPLYSISERSSYTDLAPPNRSKLNERISWN